MYLVLFDPSIERAYWLYFQKYLQQLGITSASIVGSTLTVHIDKSQELNGAAINQWRNDKAAITAKVGPVAHG